MGSDLITTPPEFENFKFLKISDEQALIDVLEQCGPKLICSFQQKDNHQILIASLRVLILHCAVEIKVMISILIKVNEP